MSSGPASHRVTNDLVVSMLRQSGKLDGDILDMGAGSGYLTGLLVKSRTKGSAGLAACDIDDAAFSGDGVPFTQCNVDEGLPFPDRSLDAVVAIEVLEHTRSSYRVLGEIARVLRPGGVVIFSVPNVGHMLSRLSFASSGHYHMFPSPSTKPENAGRLCGHVAPLASQYWHYGLRSAGFSEISLRADRIKKSAAGLAILFWPVLKLATARHLRALERREPPLYEETADVARAANSWPALASRSLVFRAVKK
jgi:2-polyprenyl-6-hydroxyphenyl methylase/3-demethylubiquinone-9 3-methyltransferase